MAGNDNQCKLTESAAEKDLCNCMDNAAQMMAYLQNIEDLPTISSAAMRVNALLQDMDTTARELAGVIEKDQSMSCKLLRLANSSFFGFSSRVSNIAHAVMILGFNTVLNAVLSMAVIDALGSKSKLSGLDMTLFWRHSIGVAVVSRYLSRIAGGPRQETAFTAGILHDIGKVVMARFFTDDFVSLWQEIDGAPVSFKSAEKKYFAMGHDAIGAFLARKWNLPEALAAVVAQHHQPEILPNANALSLVVNAADAIVHIHIDGRQPAEQWPICNSAKLLLAEKLRTIDQWLPGVQEEIEVACQSILD